MKERSTAASPRRRKASAGRPPRSPAQEAAVRAQVVAAARELFAREGFEAVSMRNIAERTGCAPMTLYGYFRSKNEILRHIWHDFFVELFARLEAAAARRGSAAQRLQRVAAAYLDYWFEHPQRYRLVYLNQDRTAAEEAFYVDSSDVVARFGLFTDLIRAAQAQGSARRGDAQLLGETLLCALQGIAHSLITIPEYPWRPREKLLRQALAVVLV